MPDVPSAKKDVANRFDYDKIYSKRQSTLYFVVCCAGFAPPLAADFLSKSVCILPEAYSQRQITFVVDYKSDDG